MDVSIILLTCNSGDTISECIDYIDISIKESKLLCELIIVDANSLDNTLSILKKKAIHTEMISTEINDRSYSFNEGVSKATGKYICRVDSRSLIPKEHIIKCFNFLEQNDGYFSVGGMMIPFNSNSKIECLYRNLISFGNSSFRHSKIDMNVDTVYLGFYKKSHFLDLGGYDTRSGFINEETDLNFHAIKNGYNIRLLSDLKVKYITRNNFKDYLMTMRRYGAARSGFFIKNNKISLKLILFFLFYILTFSNLILFSIKSEILYLVITLIQYSILYYFFMKSLRSNYLSVELKKTFFLFFQVILGHFNWIFGFISRLLTSKNKYN